MTGLRAGAVGTRSARTRVRTSRNNEDPPRVGWTQEVNATNGVNPVTGLCKDRRRGGSYGGSTGTEFRRINHAQTGTSTTHTST